jgi:hypothetical protein
MYMIRGTWRAQRGKAPMIIEALKMVNQAMTSQAGFSNGKIYADMSGPFDTVIWQFEAESLDRFYQANVACLSIRMRPPSSSSIR